MAWVQVGGAAIGAVGGIMGGKGSKSGGTPKFIRKQMKRGYGALNAATGRPVGEAIAPQNADQLRAMDMVRGNIGLGAGDINTALTQARRASGGVTGSDIAGFFNPYEDAVVGSAVSDLSRSRDMNLLNINAQAESAKAFGGDREAVAKALASEDYNRRIADTVAQLRAGGYQFATDSAFRNNEALQRGSGNLLDAVGAQREAAGADAAGLAAVGDTQFAYDQNLLDYPLKMAQLQIEAAQGGGGMQGPQSTGGNPVAGGIAGAMGGLQFGQTIGGIFRRPAPTSPYPANQLPPASGWRYDYGRP